MKGMLSDILAAFAVIQSCAKDRRGLVEAIAANKATAAEARRALAFVRDAGAADNTLTNRQERDNENTP